MAELPDEWLDYYEEDEDMTMTAPMTVEDVQPRDPNGNPKAPFAKIKAGGIEYMCWDDPSLVGARLPQIGETVQLDTYFNPKNGNHSINIYGDRNKTKPQPHAITITGAQGTPQAATPPTPAPAAPSTPPVAAYEAPPTQSTPMYQNPPQGAPMASPEQYKSASIVYQALRKAAGYIGADWPTDQIIDAMRQEMEAYFQVVEENAPKMRNG